MLFVSAGMTHLLLDRYIDGLYDGVHYIPWDADRKILHGKETKNIKRILQYRC